MQVVPRGAAGVADVGDHLPGLHLLALGDADLTAMGIERLQAAAVVDLDVVPVAAAPAVKGVGHCDRSVRVGKDWCAFGRGNVGAIVVAGFSGQRVGAVAEWRGDAAGNRQRPANPLCPLLPGLRHPRPAGTGRAGDRLRRPHRPRHGQPPAF